MDNFSWKAAELKSWQIFRKIGSALDRAGNRRVSWSISYLGSPPLDPPLSRLEAARVDS